MMLEDAYRKIYLEAIFSLGIFYICFAVVILLGLVYIASKEKK